MSTILVAGLSLLFLAVFAVAMRLDPDPRGLGTHQQLGFPPCTILTLFDFPCPTCGMTTSFAHFVRGEWASAARSSTSGLLLACLGTLYLPWAAISLYRKECWRIRQPDLWFFGLLTGWMIVTVLEWLVRVS